jgi:hypothetical protein
MSMPAKNKPNYRELVAEAEAAVAAVKDPELRRAAFEKILEQLLEAPHSNASKATKESPSSSAKFGGKTTKPRRGPRAYVEELIADGFFSHQKTIAEVKAELANRGHHVPLTGLSGPLQNLCQAKSLRRQKTKADGKKKTVFAYSNW